MTYVESPNELETNGSKSLFLAGGITGCPDWQKKIARQLCRTSVILFNPRRANFPIEDASAAFKQIEWEHKYLRKASAISFWFPCETLCPIVLYELGAWSMTDKPIFVGVHPKYARKNDVEVQTRLVRKEVKIVYSTDELIAQILTWSKT